ncbi:MAG: hypothetical protein E7607_08185 [Ruminococcaceae bacterium]|nr:hypothetical protein [Oscillospiraceae bacterium]
MNKEQGQAERDYRLAKAVFMTLRDKCIITDAELSAVERLKPMVGELEVNSIAEEKSYTG